MEFRGRGDRPGEDEMETTPLAVAQMIMKGAEAVGAKVTYSNANERGRAGFMHITMPDGEVVTIQIEIQ
jgi:major membrane immunogen (membrane-anchored lipoprotein)